MYQSYYSDMCASECVLVGWLNIHFHLLGLPSLDTNEVTVVVK